MKKRTAFRYIAGVVAAGLMLTGCTSGGATPSESGDSTKLVDFLWTGPALPATTDPVENGPLQAIVAVEMSGLPVKYDVTKLKDNGLKEMAGIEDVVGDMAESWKYSDDGKSLLMTFKKGVKSSFGNELTSEDVKWTFDRARALSSTVTNLLKTTSIWVDGEAISIVDDHTVSIALKEKSAMDAAMFLLFRWVIMDSTEAKKHATADDPWATKFLQKNSANFGPWKWTEADWNPGKELTMTRNENYYNKKELGNIGRVIMRVIPEGSTRAQLVNSGEVDYAGQLAPADYKLVQDAKTAQVIVGPAGDRDTLVLQQKDKRFADVRVRKALSLAIDRKLVADAAYQGGLADGATDGLSQAYKFDRPPAAQRVKFDPTEAKKLLAEAGYPNGFSFELLYSPGRPGPQAEQLAVSVKSQLADIGVTANLKVVASPADFQKTFLDGRYEATIYQEPPAIPDPAYAAGLYSLSGGYQNSYNYANADYDRLQHLLAITPPGAERNKYMTQISALIMDTMPVIYLLDTKLPRAFSKAIDVKSYHHHPYSTTLKMYTLVKKS